MAIDPLDTLPALDSATHPDPVDIYEGLLAIRLGLTRHPGLDQVTWRRVREAFTETAGERADLDAERATRASGRAADLSKIRSRLRCSRCTNWRPGR